MKLKQFARTTIFFVLLSPIIGLQATDVANTTKDRLPSQIRQILENHKAPASSFSLYIKEIGAPQPWITLNSQLPRNPASTIKIVTTLAGLALLGSDYTWKTNFYLDGQIVDSTLNGNLVMSGGGDPLLVVESFWHILFTLQANGLKHIKGDLLLDNSVFEVESANPGDFDNKPYRAYNVVPNATLVNFGTHQFHFIPQHNGLHIYTDPPTKTIQIINNIRLNKGKCNAKYYNYSYRIDNNDEQYTSVAFFGKYPFACGSRRLLLSVQSNELYIYGVFKSLWESMGGTITGTVGKTEVDSKKPFYVATSKPLSEMVMHINKYSNNVMARHLFLTIGKESQILQSRQGQGSKELGRQAIQRWLASINIDAPELFLDNGSGLSRSSTISAKTLGMLLEWADGSPYQPEFMTSLPILGVDGTLRKRIKYAPAGRVRVKTGLLNGVRSMAGYVHSASDKQYIVVSLQNHPDAHNGTGTKIQDKILQWLYQQ